MVRVRRVYRAIEPRNPRVGDQMVRNQMDNNDQGRSEADRLRQFGLRARDGVPRNLVDFAMIAAVSPGMVDYNPKPRSVINVSSRTVKQNLYDKYHWWDRRITYLAVFTAIREILRQTFMRMIERGHAWIDTFVPKATGQLRTSLKKQMHAPTNLSPDGTKLVLRIGSYVHYLPIVATMGRRNLQHSPPQRRFVRYYGPPRWVVLDDPRAEKYFFMRLIMFMRRVIREELARSIMQVSNRLGWPQFWFRDAMRTEDVN